MEILAGLRKANSDVLKISGNFVEVSEQAKSIVVMNRECSRMILSVFAISHKFAFICVHSRLIELG